MNYLIIVATSVVFMLWTGLNVFAQEKDHQHKEHLSKILEYYMDTKNALVSDDFELARKSISKLQDEVIGNAEMNHHKEHAKMHNKHHASMVTAMSEAASAEELSELRGAFADISENLIMAIENQDYGEEKLFLQYCPMAVDGEGAKWISKDKEIANPYMGQKMPGCGKTEEMIE